MALPQNVKSITVYATRVCPYCKALKGWFKKNNIDFEEILVDENPAKADEMIKKSGQMGVPVTEIIFEDEKSEIVIGYDRAELAQMFGIKEE